METYVLYSEIMRNLNSEIQPFIEGSWTMVRARSQIIGRKDGSMTERVEK